MSLVFGIGGISRSGKSTLAKGIAGLLNDSVILHQDEYNAPRLPMLDGHIDWEVPAAVDFEKLIRAVRNARETHSIVIVEGILIFSNAELNQLFSRRIILTLEEEEFKKRKRQDLRWGREPDWYIHHIWLSFLRYGYPPEEFDLIEIDATNPPAANDVLKMSGIT